MNKYRLSVIAKDDLIRIHHYGVKTFGIAQADTYFELLFEYFESIAERPLSFESVDFIKTGYRRCICGSNTIYFRVNNDFVDIMTIIGRQDLNKII